MKPGLSLDVVQKLAVALEAEGVPPVKDGVSYRILVFKVTESQLWVTAMIPMNAGIEPHELFDQVNVAYGEYLNVGSSTKGILFFQDADTDHLINIVTHWYYESNRPKSSFKSRASNN